MSNSNYKYVPKTDITKEVEEDGQKTTVAISEYDLSRQANEDAYNRTMETIESAYGVSKGNIFEDYDKAVKDAEIARAVASKYLPEQMARMGWDTNLGATTSGSNQIMANYGQSVNAANETKANAMAELDLYRQDAEKNALELMYNANSVVDAEERAAKRASYEKIIQEYIAGTGTVSQKEVEDAYNSLDEYTLKKYSGEYQLKNTLAGFGVTDMNTKIPLNAAVTEFGTYTGTGAGGWQDKWVESILTQIANNPSAYNGMIFDFNIGDQKEKGKSHYVYYNGYFYKTGKDADVYYRSGKDKAGTTKNGDYVVWDGVKKEETNNG